ncbi:PH domain-containing protein [Candidatus Parcubacteria bacterium]|nr:PH domain-containing protein [Candidatus Parcubacteria bacterium]
MSKKETDSSQKKYFEDQLDDEEVLYVFRKHPIVMRKGLVLGLLALLLSVVPSLVKPEYYILFGGLGIGLVLCFLILLPAWITWYFSVYIVTDKRLLQISQKGLWNKSVVDIALNQIQMVNYQIAGFNETVLGFGTIKMQTFVGDLVIHEVHHPEKIQRKILEILREKGIIINSPPQLNEADEA